MKGGKNDKANAKALRLKERQDAEARKNTYVKDPNDPCAHKFGDLELNRS